MTICYEVHVIHMKVGDLRKFTVVGGSPKTVGRRACRMLAKARCEEYDPKLHQMISIKELEHE